MSVSQSEIIEKVVPNYVSSDFLISGSTINEEAIVEKSP